MKYVLPILLIIFLQSCCSPHFVGYVNPLFLKSDGYEKTCPLSYCKPGEKCKGKYIPWLNLEYEYSNQHYTKIGASYLRYTKKSILIFTGNYLTNKLLDNKKDLQHGIGLETQIGFLPINGYYTNFLGLEYNHFLGSKILNQIHPTVGFAPPFKIANSFQVKAGYQINPFEQKNYWTIGINLKIPIVHLL